MEEQALFSTQQEFVNDGETYVYDFNSLTVEQAELAREAGEFKQLQNQNLPTNFETIMKSNAADWVILLNSFLLLKKKDDGKLEVFDRATQPKTKDFIRRLPWKESERLRDVINDFFTNSGRPTVGLSLLNSEKRTNKAAMLLPLILNSLTGMKQEENS